jgi:LmbE family N-acetylglucosaminyl deacetylase
MLPLTLKSQPGAPIRVLCLGAHADDIEIGCGGTVLQLLAERPGTSCHWIVFSGTAERACEARNSADRFLRAAGRRRVEVHEFTDGHFPVALSAIKNVLEDVKRDFSPDLILTHYRDDRHQDHRVVSDVTWQTFRDQLILEYEIPKYDGDLGAPNCFVALADEVRKQKVSHLLAGFPSQRDKRWFSEETFFALMRLRGMECAAPGGYAEAFYGRKLTLHFASGT